MSEITFSGSVKSALIDKLQQYCERELDVELGQFDAEFLLDFVSKEMGSHYYNQGLYDAQALLLSKMDNLTEAISELEKDAT